jgi:FkbM family methyltransferase
MLDTPLVTTARSIKVLLQSFGANRLIALGQSFYHSIWLKDSGTNYVRKRMNGEIYKFVPALALASDTYEPHVMQWLKQSLHPGDTFWDVGANFGFTALPAAKIVGSGGQVIAVEPSPANLAWLKRHIALNDCTDIVTVLESAVCEQQGGTVTLSLLDSGQSPSNSLMFSGGTNAAQPKVSQQVSVPAISLDGLLADQRRVPQLVKIDVEGAELRVLQGATQLLKHESSPILLLAVHPFWQAASDDCHKIVELLKNAGYRIVDQRGSVVETLEFDEYLCIPAHL